jgi:hypothetical protein
MENDKIDLGTTPDEQDGRNLATDPSELGDADLGQVSGGCRKAGGELVESELTIYKPIIAI